MTEPAIDRSWRRRLSNSVLRLLSIADEPGDEDDLRRRKRVGVAAGLLTIIAPLTLPLQVPDEPIAWVIGISLSAFSLVNLVVLARTGVFERFVVALVLAGVVFVPAANFLGGGITGPSTGLVWAFLVPGYAILALGPRRAARWFVVYLALVALMVVLDPFARAWAGPSPYAAHRVRTGAEHGAAAGHHLPAPALHGHSTARGGGPGRRAPDERDPDGHRDPPAARRTADRRRVSRHHDPVRGHRGLHSMGPADPAGSGGGGARRASSRHSTS